MKQKQKVKMNDYKKYNSKKSFSFLYEFIFILGKKSTRRTITRYYKKS